jgi:hypothetical protein
MIHVSPGVRDLRPRRQSAANFSTVVRTGIQAGYPSGRVVVGLTDEGAGLQIEGHSALMVATRAHSRESPTWQDRVAAENSTIRMGCLSRPRRRPPQPLPWPSQMGTVTGNVRDAEAWCALVVAHAPRVRPGYAEEGKRSKVRKPPGATGGPKDAMSCSSTLWILNTASHWSNSAYVAPLG